MKSLFSRIVERIDKFVENVISSLKPKDIEF